MSEFYTEAQRSFQASEKSIRIADRLEETRRRSAFNADDERFVRDMCFFFLATADAKGRPDCSFKGGAPGFVRVVNSAELAFPNYDGNGMFRSLGNITENPSVGLLFVDFTGAKRRLRVNGTATISFSDPLLELYPGATHVVRVAARDIFPNCPRYIPTMVHVIDSPYVPRAGQVPPEPEWKSKPDLKDYVPSKKDG